MLLALQKADAEGAIAGMGDDGQGPVESKRGLSDDERGRIRRMGILTGLAIALHNCMSLS